MVREAGAEHVIIGHSERRTLFGETDTTVNQKVIAALTAGLVPIVCVGETLDQRELRETFDVLDNGRSGRGSTPLTPDQIGQLVIAYEPVWAIGTGRTATAAQAAEAHAHIRAAVAPVVQPRGGRALPPHLRRECETGQHGGAHRPAGRGRGARRGREPECGELSGNRHQKPRSDIMAASRRRLKKCCTT